MSEEMKMILALIDHLGKEIRCTGEGVPDDTLVDADCFSRDKKGNYTYEVSDKP